MLKKTFTRYVPLCLDGNEPPCLLVNSCPKAHGPKTPSSRSLAGTIKSTCLKPCLFTHMRCFQEYLGGHAPRLRGCWREFEWSCGIPRITCTLNCE
jgi:hypothetical protein